MSSPSNNSAVPMPLDAQGRLDEDMPCINCRYSLRSTLPEGNCPECGEPVARSFDERLLYLRDPKWLSRLKNGCIFLFILAFVAFILTFVIAEFFISDTHRFPDGNAINFAMGLCLVTLFVLGGFCKTVFDLTASDKVMRADSSQRFHRWLACSCLWGSALLTFTLLTTYMLVPPRHWTVLPSRAMVIGLLLVGLWALMIHLSRLARWIPDPRLAHGCESTALGYLSFGILLGLFQWVSPRNGEAFFMTTAIVVILLTLAATIVLAIWFCTRITHASRKAIMRKNNRLARDLENRRSMAAPTNTPAN